MTRCVCCVATGRYVRGMDRLTAALLTHSADTDMLRWADVMPPGSPSHAEVPYGFKAHALKAAQDKGYDLVLWADASILPVRSLEPLWDLIEHNGAWFSRGGWSNGQWCSDASLPLLGITREEAFAQEHVAATAFGLDLRSDVGKAFLTEYLRFAANGAFCGPWKNDQGQASSDARVLGHRHDQSGCSVIAERLRIPLTNPPQYFAYPPGDETTVLLADGGYA